MKSANTLNYLKDLFFKNRNENCKQLDIEFMISSLLNVETMKGVSLSFLTKRIPLR